MNNLFQRLMPFLFLGIMLVVLVAGLILLSYLLIWGAIVGLVLFLIAWIREKFFPTRQLTKSDKKRTSNRIIDHEDK
ncbi:MAG TPA: hypothetical protein VLI69_03245 [Gammaproteobacteria bacterium]|nr:hypothetical protein [Gammaproteobacteria bacterium]